MRAATFRMILIILFSASACQSTSPAVQPTRALASPIPAQTARPTQLNSAALRPTAMPTATLQPTDSPFIIAITPPDQPPPATADPLLLTQIAAPALPGDTEMIGTSLNGRPLLARRIGSGPRILLLAGGMHGGWEANTVTLINALITHFAESPQSIPAALSLIFIPAVNPDGLQYGREPAGRFNGGGVDLNRNWGCGWRTDAVWRDMPVNPGPYAFSEPETAALADYIQRVRPEVALFYHSAAGGVFAGSCEQSIYGAQGAAVSEAMSAVYGEAAGYSYGSEFDAYPVTGTAAAWASGLGIASADVELQTWTEPEFERNLAAIEALMAWMMSGGS